MSDVVSPQLSETPAPRKLSKQDKLIQAYITDAEIFLDTASEDDQILPLLEARGYDADEFADAFARVEEARSAFEGRALGLGRKIGGTEVLFSANQTARNEYARFREIARAAFTAKGDRISLSITGDVPEDTGRFITVARASYEAGKKEPHATKLAKRGYTTEALDADLAALKSLTGSAADHEEEKGDAMGDTSERDAAYDRLREFMKELKGVARGALRGRQDLLSKLGL
jgi:hypothetical protein